MTKGDHDAKKRWPPQLEITKHFLQGATDPSGSGPPPYRGSKITPWHTTLGGNPMDEWPSRRRDLYLTTHNARNRQTFMPPAGFEPVIPATERPQTAALDRMVTGIGLRRITVPFICSGRQNSVSGHVTVTSSSYDSQNSRPRTYSRQMRTGDSLICFYMNPRCYFWSVRPWKRRQWISLRQGVIPGARQKDWHNISE